MMMPLQPASLPYLNERECLLLEALKNLLALRIAYT